MGYIGVITHLLTFDPNFQRDIQYSQFQSLSTSGAPSLLAPTKFFPVDWEFDPEKHQRRENPCHKTLKVPESLGTNVEIFISSGFI